MTGTESLAAVAFYAGLGALIFGSVRIVRARLEGQRRETWGFAAVALAVACFALAVSVFARGPRGVLPF